MPRAQTVDNRLKFLSNHLATDRFFATNALRRNEQTDQLLLDAAMAQEWTVKCLTPLALLADKQLRFLSVLRKVAQYIA